MVSTLPLTVFISGISDFCEATSLIFIGACLFKIPIKMLRKCWYSILFMSCFNISLSSSAPNSSFRKFLQSLQYTIFGFGFGKYCFKTFYKLVKARDCCFKLTAILETLRGVCQKRSIHDGLSGFSKHVFCFTKLFKLQRRTKYLRKTLVFIQRTTGKVQLLFLRILLLVLTEVYFWEEDQTIAYNSIKF